MKNLQDLCQEWADNKLAIAKIDRDIRSSEDLATTLVEEDEYYVENLDRIALNKHNKNYYTATRNDLLVKKSDLELQIVDFVKDLGVPAGKKFVADLKGANDLTYIQTYWYTSDNTLVHTP